MIHHIRETPILIAGAGLIGLSCALSLEKLGFTVQIVESNEDALSPSSHTSSRPISLSYGSVRMLRALNIWEKLAPHASPILSVHVSEAGKFGYTHFTAAEQHVPALGYVIPLATLQNTLYQAVIEKNNIMLSGIKQILSIHASEHATVVTTDSQEIKTGLFIAADGTDSVCRELLSIERIEKNEGDTALLFQLLLSESHDQTAYERFTTLGVFAILPLPEKNKAQLVWTITSRIAKKIACMNETQLTHTIQDFFDGRLSIHSAKKITEFPIRTVLSKKQRVERCVLIGNAAHTIYPVAAQGFNLGLQDIGVLSDALINNNLDDYEKRIAKQQKAIFCITNELISAFELPLIGPLRGLGLLATDLLSPIKNKLAHRTMGIAEKMPEFMRKTHHE